MNPARELKKIANDLERTSATDEEEYAEKMKAEAMIALDHILEGDNIDMLEGSLEFIKDNHPNTKAQETAVEIQRLLDGLKKFRSELKSLL